MKTNNNKKMFAEVCKWYRAATPWIMHHYKLIILLKTNMLLFLLVHFNQCLCQLCTFVSVSFILNLQLLQQLKLFSPRKEGKKRTTPQPITKFYCLGSTPMKNNNKNHKQTQDYSKKPLAIIRD